MSLIQCVELQAENSTEKVNAGSYFVSYECFTIPGVGSIRKQQEHWG